MAVLYPAIGQWFQRPTGVLFEVVAVDEGERTVEIQQFDGTIDEIDVESWTEWLVTEVAAPEDWSGSVDMEPEDHVDVTAAEMPAGFHDPMEFLDKL